MRYFYVCGSSISLKFAQNSKADEIFPKLEWEGETCRVNAEKVEFKSLHQC